MPGPMILATQGKLTRAASGVDRDKLMELARLASLDEDIAEGDPDPEFFRVWASTDAIDSYGTYMMESTLRNFAEDATFDGESLTGVSVLDSHDGRRLGFGRSLTGEYVSGDDLPAGATQGFRSTFFTVPGIRVPNGGSTDDYIRGIKRGLWSDVSVGFWLPPDARITCTICGGDMHRWWTEDGCWDHFPGVETTVEANGTKTREVAYGGVENGRLSEFSFVYDGATPGAGIAKARSMEDAGELDWRIAATLEQAYHTTFPRAMAGRVFPARPAERERISKERGMENEEQGIEGNVTEPAVDGDVPTVFGGEEPQEGATTTPETEWDDRMPESYRSALNTAIASTGIAVGSRVGSVIRDLANKVHEVRELNRSLERDAADGRVYRADIENEVIRNVIRCLPQNADVPTTEQRYRRMMAGMSLDDVKALRDEKRAEASARFPSERITRDDANSEPKHYDIPVSVYEGV